MKKYITHIYLFLVSIEGIFVAQNMLRSYFGAGLALRQSAKFSALLGGVILLVIASLGALLFFWKMPKAQRNFEENVSRGKWFRGLVLLFALVSGFSFQHFTVLSISDSMYPQYVSHVKALVLWIVVIGAQSLAALFAIQIKKGFAFSAPRWKSLGWMLPFLLLLILWGLFWITGYGYSDRVEYGNFHKAGAPIVGIQVLVAWIITMGLALWLGGEQEGRWRNFLKSELLICIVLWALAFTLWVSAPFDTNWFIDIPRSPNFEFYPNSDALSYDLPAQRLLVGHGMGTEKRPMHSLFLAFLHIIGGIDYIPVLWMQLVVLALFPVYLYKITKELHHRFSGILVAFLFIMRERTSILLGDTITTTHGKLLMTDLPATLGVTIFLYFIIKWLRDPEKHKVAPLAAGGVMGFFILVRFEILFMVPFVAFGALFVLRHRLKSWGRGVALITLGIMLMLAPEAGQNWAKTGEIYVGTWGSVGSISEKIKNGIDFYFSEEDDQEQGFVPLEQGLTRKGGAADPIEISSGSQTSGGGVLSAIVQTPLFSDDINVLDATLNHYFHSLEESVFYLPNTYRAFFQTRQYCVDRSEKQMVEECLLEQYVRDLPFWWREWDGDLPPRSFLPVLKILFLISVGLWAVWKRGPYLVLIPFLAFQAHILVYLIDTERMMTGGRFLHPVDWITGMFYGIGLFELSAWGLAWVRGKAMPALGDSELSQKIDLEPTASGRPMFHERPTSRGLGKYVMVGLIIFLVGSSLPITEELIPQQYTQEETDQKLNQLLSSSDSVLSSDEKVYWRIMDEKWLTVLYGRALYPRFFEKGEHAIDAKKESDYAFSRVEFHIVGIDTDTARVKMVLPTTYAPEFFPNGSDVLLLGNGNANKSHFIPQYVLVYDSEGTVREVLKRTDLLPIPPDALEEWLEQQ